MPFETYKPGDVVRKYNIAKDSPMNFNDAKEIFAGRMLNRAVSKPKKGSNAKPFTLDTLTEVWEIVPPKPTTFRGPSRVQIL